MSKTRGFRASLVLNTGDAETASIIWSSIYPNFSPRDLDEGKLGAELRECEIRIVVTDESLSKLRARLSSVLVWLDVVQSILKKFTNEWRGSLRAER